MDTIYLTAIAPALDADILSPQNYILIDEKKRIYWNEQEIVLQESLEIAYPIIRILSPTTFLLVDGDHSPREEDNAWIIQKDGNIRKSFYIGAAHDVEIIGNKIIAAYGVSSLNTSRIVHSNEQAFSDVSQSALAVFDHAGHCLFEYMKDAKEADFIPFMENGAFVKKDEHSVYCLMYQFNGHFSIMQFDLLDYTLKWLFDLPEECAPIAMTQKQDTWYFLLNDNKAFEDQIDFTKLTTRLVKFIPSSSIEIVGELDFINKAKAYPNGSFSIPNSPLNKRTNLRYLTI